MPYIRHAKSITYADCTDSDKLRPSDWNSSHEQHWTLQGNTLGASTLSGTNIQLAGGSNITLSVAGQTVSIVGASGGGGGIAGVMVSGAATSITGLITSGTVIFSNFDSFPRVTYHNVQFIASNNTIHAVVAPQEFMNDAFIAFGLLNDAREAHMDVYRSDSAAYITFQMSGGSEAQEYMLRAVSDAAVHTLALHDDLPVLGMSNIGNTAGTTGVVSGLNERMLLAGGANITLSQSINGASATVSIVGAAGGGGVALSANGSSQSGGTVVLSNSNNVSFGMNGSTITASASYSQSTAPSAIVASNSTWTAGSVVFTGSNNITVNYNASTVVISGANTHAQQTGISGIAGSAASTVTNGTLVFSNLNGVSFGLNGSTMSASIQTSYAASNHSHGNPTLNLTNLSGTTASNSAGFTLSLSASTYLVTAAQSDHSHGNPSLALTNLSGTTASNSAGLTLSLSAAAPGAAALALSAGTVSQNAGTIVFSNSNGVSFGMNGSTITASAAAGGGGVALSAGTTAATSGTVIFSNSNSISFGMNGQTITASGAFADAMVTLTAGNNMSLSASTNGVSATITFNNLLSSSATAVGVNSVSSAGTLASRFALADHQHALAFSNTNGVSFGWNAGTITASVGAAPAAGIAAIAGSAASSVTSGTMQFDNANGVSFGLNGSTMTASILDPNRAGTGTTFAGANITGAMTFNTEGLNLSLSAAAPGGAGFTKSIKVLGEDFIGFNTGSNYSSHAIGSIWFNPIHMDSPISISYLNVVKSFGMSLSTSSNSSGVQSISYGHTWRLFYRSDFAANSLSLSFQTSGSWGISFSRSHTSNNNSITVSWVTNSTGGTSSWSSASAGVGLSSYWTGARHVHIPMVTSLSQGEWFIAHQHSATYANAGSTSSFCPISNANWSLQGNTAIPLGGITGQSRWNQWHGIGFGRATAITTNAVMNGSAVSADSLQYWHGVMANMGIY